MDNVKMWRIMGRAPVVAVDLPVVMEAYTGIPRRFDSEKKDRNNDA